MRHVIRTDNHFDLTPSIRDHVEASLEKLESVLPESALVHVFLSEPARGLFQAAVTVRFAGKDFFAAETDENLYVAISQAKAQLFRAASSRRHKRVTLRRAEAFPKSA